MSKDGINKIRNTRIARKAQVNSGLLKQIKILQKEIVNNSFSNQFNKKPPRLMMDRLRNLNSEYSNKFNPDTTWSPSK